MKIGVVAAGIALFALLLLSGCPKSNEMLEHSQKPGAIQQPGQGNGQGELTQGTPPAGGAKTPPPVSNGGDSGSSGGGDTGGGDTGGDDGGDDGGA